MQCAPIFVFGGRLIAFLRHGAKTLGVLLLASLIFLLEIQLATEENIRFSLDNRVQCRLLVGVGYMRAKRVLCYFR